MFCGARLEKEKINEEKMKKEENVELFIIQGSFSSFSLLLPFSILLILAQRDWFIVSNRAEKKRKIFSHPLYSSSFAFPKIPHPTQTCFRFILSFFLFMKYFLPFSPSSHHHYHHHREFFFPYG